MYGVVVGYEVHFVRGSYELEGPPVRFVRRHQPDSREIFSGEEEVSATGLRVAEVPPFGDGDYLPEFGSEVGTAVVPVYAEPYRFFGAVLEKSDAVSERPHREFSTQRRVDNVAFFHRMDS